MIRVDVGRQLTLFLVLPKRTPLQHLPNSPHMVAHISAGLCNALGGMVHAILTFNRDINLLFVTSEFF